MHETEDINTDELEKGEKYMATSDFTGEDMEVFAVEDGEGGIMLRAADGTGVTDVVSDVREIEDEEDDGEEEEDDGEEEEDGELVEKWEKGNARVIDDIGDGHEVELVESNDDTDSVVLRFHADDGREIETAISEDDVKLDDGKMAKIFGADAILVTPAHVSGDIHEEASGIYAQ